MAFRPFRLLAIAAVVMDTRVQCQVLQSRGRENAWQANRESVHASQVSHTELEVPSNEHALAGMGILSRTRRLDQIIVNRKRPHKLDTGPFFGSPKGQILSMRYKSAKSKKANEKKKSKGKKSKGKSKKKTKSFETPTFMPTVVPSPIASPTAVPTRTTSPQTGAPTKMSQPMVTPSPTISNHPTTPPQSMSPSAPQILLSNIPSSSPSLCVGQECSRPPRPI